jgi:tetratricopeptide (TPR) repeat protein
MPDQNVCLNLTSKENDAVRTRAMLQHRTSKIRLHRGFVARHILGHWGKYMRRIAVVLSTIGFLASAVHFANANDYDICHRSQGDPAIAACTRAILSGRFSGRDLAYLLGNRGAEYLRKDDYDRAFADINHAIRLDPSKAVNFRNRANIYHRKKDYDRALVDYNQAIRLNSRYADAFQDRARLYYNKSEFDRAIADLNEAIRLEPDSDKFVDRGDAYYNKGDYDRAISDYSEAIRLSPESPAPYASRCWTRGAANRQLSDALADCNKSLSLRPGDAETLDSRGFVYFRLGRFDEAITDFDAALAKNPELAQSLFIRGLAKSKKGDNAGGDADIAAAKKIDPAILERNAKRGVQATATERQQPKASPQQEIARTPIAPKSDSDQKQQVALFETGDGLRLEGSAFWQLTGTAVHASIDLGNNRTINLGFVLSEKSLLLSLVQSGLENVDKIQAMRVGSSETVSDVVHFRTYTKNNQKIMSFAEGRLAHFFLNAQQSQWIEIVWETTTGKTAKVRFQDAKGIGSNLEKLFAVNSPYTTQGPR